MVLDGDFDDDDEARGQGAALVLAGVLTVSNYEKDNSNGKSEDG